MEKMEIMTLHNELFAVYTRKTRLAYKDAYLQLHLLYCCYSNYFPHLATYSD